MIRRLLTCLLLITLILQGMTAATAGVYELSDSSQHCSDHRDAAGDCPCCSEAGMLAGACASTCSAMVGLPPLAMLVPAVSPAAPDFFDDDPFLSAVHPPLDRPPIA